jgi:hypothetical protein
MVPDNFRRDDDFGGSYVAKQPETAEEIRKCQEALEECHVSAIHCDGLTATEFVSTASARSQLDNNKTCKTGCKCKRSPWGRLMKWIGGFLRRS